MTATATASDSSLAPAGLEITAPISDAYREILTPEALNFLVTLQREFGPRRLKLLQFAFCTDNPLTMPVSGPGSAGMETCFVNLVRPGDTVVVCENGVFGGRMKENVLRTGGTPVMVQDAWGEPVDPAKVADALAAHPEASLVAFVHAETSTGALSDAEALVSLAHKHDCLTIVDTVTSLGGVPVRVDAWGVDATYSGSQKCLSCTPGLSLFVREEARLPQLNAVTIPDGVDDLEVRNRLLADFQLEIGGGLGAMADKIWRIGLMGHACRGDNVLLCLTALEQVLGDKVQRGVALDAARAALKTEDAF